MNRDRTMAPACWLLVVSLVAACLGPRNKVFDAKLAQPPDSVHAFLKSLTPVELVDLLVYSQVAFHPPLPQFRRWAISGGPQLGAAVAGRARAEGSKVNATVLVELVHVLVCPPSPQVDSAFSSALGAAVSSIEQRFGSELARPAKDALSGSC